MAKVYAAPEKAPEVDYKDYDFAAEEKRAQEYIERMQQWCRENGNGKYAGELYTVGVADGKAIYVVWKTKPLSLIHLEVWDNYSASPAEERGTRLDDIERHINFEKWWKDLGEKQKAEREAQGAN